MVKGTELACCEIGIRTFSPIGQEERKKIERKCGKEQAVTRTSA